MDNKNVDPVSVDKELKTITNSQTQFTASYAPTLNALIEKYKDEEGIDLKILESNAIHFTKMQLGQAMQESYITNILGAEEIPNFTEASKGYLVLDMLNGSAELQHNLISLKSDGRVDTYALPFNLFRIASDIETTGKYKTMFFQSPTFPLLDKMKEKFGVTWDTNATNNTRINVKLPFYGHIIGLSGEMETLVEMELIRTSIEKTGHLCSYMKMVYVGGSDSFEFVNTTFITPQLQSMMSEKFIIVKERVAKETLKEKKKNKKDIN